MLAVCQALSGSGQVEGGVAGVGCVRCGGCGALPGPGCPYDWTPGAARTSGEMGGGVRWQDVSIVPTMTPAN